MKLRWNTGSECRMCGVHLQRQEKGAEETKLSRVCPVLTVMHTKTVSLLLCVRLCVCVFVCVRTL